MLYRCDLNDPKNAVNFGVVVDDETMTWTSDPPGQDVSKLYQMYFSPSGPARIGSGKKFEVSPGGAARLLN